MYIYNLINNKLYVLNEDIENNNTNNKIKNGVEEIISDKSKLNKLLNLFNNQNSDNNE